MMNNLKMGFKEEVHTADWAITVWAPTLAELFRQSTIGMLSLMGVTSNESESSTREIKVSSDDKEGLLVAFLSEILNIIEVDKQVPIHYSITVDRTSLTSQLILTPISSIRKEIKAVTFHNLAITKKGKSWQAQIVFDV
jgi:SHS2 domain-containing protein